MTSVGNPVWPAQARIAVVFQIILENWSGSRVDGLGFVPKISDYGASRDTHDELNASLQRYGGEVGLPRIVRLLDEYGVTATGVMNGSAVERYPDVVNAFANGRVEREVCAHSWAQDLHVFKLSRDELRENVRRCSEVIEKVVGRRPVGWVSPAALASDFTPDVLIEHGYLYQCDYADTDSAVVVQRPAGRIVRMSVPWEVNDASQYSRSYNPPSSFVEIFRRSFQELHAEGGGVLGVAAHAMIYGRPFGVSALREVLDLIRGYDDVWVTTREQIARRVLARHSAG